jgi:16S rRNA C967 or C1407 C5-methylase (RsmB/RsmF family)/NOL1/NOP2/fmu family ribosome biogenesis protein
VLPPQLIQSLTGIKGFNSKAFEVVHVSGEQVTSVRLNPLKAESEMPKAKNIEDAAFSPQPSALCLQPSAFSIASPVPWCEHGFYLTARPSFTFDPLFHAGAYYVQEASSMFLWEVLKQTVAVSSQKKVLDLCAAPGGKSTLLASYFTDGLVVSNEVIKSRAAILTENITKWGADHVVVTNNDPKDFQRLENFFDVIVIDAPCSGSGLFRKDPDAVSEWSEENVKLCSLRQQRIVADVLPALKQNGILIYSTCSYSKQEDEEVLDWIAEELQVTSCKLQVNHNWNIVEVESDQHKACGYRFYPDQIKGEGFFIAAFTKSGGDADSYHQEQNINWANKQELEQLHSFIPLPNEYKIFKQGEALRAIKEQWVTALKNVAKHLYIKKAGVELGMIKGKDFIPSHELALSMLPLQTIASVELDKEAALQYLKRKDFTVSAAKGWTLVKYGGLPLGWIKVLPNRINNYYPTEWRILKD